MPVSTRPMSTPSPRFPRAGEDSCRFHGFVIQRRKKRRDHIVGMNPHRNSLRCQRHMKDHIVAAHIIHTDGWSVEPFFVLQGAETVNQVRHILSGRIERAVSHGRPPERLDLVTVYAGNGETFGRGGWKMGKIGRSSGKRRHILDGWWKT